MNEKMNQLPAEQRPYEKCLRYGPTALTETELLAVILRNGTRTQNALSLSASVMAFTNTTPNPGLPGLLHLSVQELVKIPGIGKVKAVQLKCIGELSRRLSSAKARMHMIFDDPSSVADYYMEKLRHEEQESMIVMLVDTKRQFLGEFNISRGTANATVVTPREILREALRMQAMGIILVHNHPSGDPSPSLDDIRTTRTVKEAADITGIELLDHIIIGDNRYFSFREQDMIQDHDI